MGKKILIISNSILILCILFLLYSKFHVDKIKLNCNFSNSIPHNLLNIIYEEEFLNIAKDLSLIMIFNKLPFKSNIEDIEKLYKKYKDNINFFTLFNKRFHFNSAINFPYKLITKTKLKIICNYDNHILDRNFFILEKNNKIIHVSNNLSLININFLLSKEINPNYQYNDYAIPTEKFKENIINRLKKGSIYLFDLNTSKFINSDEIIQYSKIYFIHGECSPCELKRLISKLRLKQIIENDNFAIVFSVYGNSFELHPLIKEYKIHVPIFLDKNDEFNLFSVITEEINNPIIISVNKIWEKID